MVGANNTIKLRFKAMMNKEKSKVLFAEADSDFADILLSFLTLPLGRILKILEKEYGDKAPTIGSLSNLCRSLANLDRSLMDDAKKTALLNPRSCFEAEYQRLKLNISDSITHVKCSKGVVDDDGVFTLKGTSFIITDDLQILPSETGLLRITSFLGITNMDGTEQIQVEFGLSEIMSLLKASLTSSTPLSDVILNRTNSANIFESQLPIKSPPQVDEEFATRFGNISLKVTIQRSTGKLVHAQAKEDFMRFLFSIINLPSRAAFPLIGVKTSFKAIENLYHSVAELIDENYFKKGMKTRLMKRRLILAMNNTPPITREPLLCGQRSYQVMDDLTVVPFSIMSMLSTLKEQKIALSDVEEVELQIGLKEALCILRASLSSTVLTDALAYHIPNKLMKKHSLSSTTVVTDALGNHTPNKRVKIES